MANFADHNQDIFAMDHDHEDLDQHHHTISRLSMCNSIEDDTSTMYMSRLSMESFDGDADEELSDSDKDYHVADCYSLPGTPRQARRKNQLISEGVFKEYASENEVILQKGTLVKKKTNRRDRVNRRKMVSRERWIEKSTNWDTSVNAINELGSNAHNITHSSNNYSCSESDGAGLLVITRPKGGKRTLCLDMEEVKACNDLGFELEHERMLDIPSGISLSASNIDTSSGGNSPIASWRISSPGSPAEVRIGIVLEPRQGFHMLERRCFGPPQTLLRRRPRRCQSSAQSMGTGSGIHIYF